MTDDASRPGDRIAKVIARAGLASRRDAEAMVEALRVTVNGRTISNVATNVGEGDRVAVDGAPLPRPEAARLWLYHKPAGLVTTERDEKGRETVFDALRPTLGRVLSVGRLDLTTEGLLLLTNDGALKRSLELPATGWLRRYRVRVNGEPLEGRLERLRQGIEVDGEDGRETFAPMQVALDRVQGANAWLTMGLREGRNREVRRALEAVSLYVNRLIRVSYGPFQLGTLEPGAVEEVKPRVLREQLGGLFDGTLAKGRQGGPMAEGEDEGAGREGAGPARGRKPRPSGDRLLDRGRGKPGAGAKGGARPAHARADAAEGRAERAARPDRPRTAKAPVTRNDGDGSRPDRPKRDLEGRHRGGGGRAKDGASGRPGGGGKPWSKDGPRAGRGDGPASDREPRPKDGDRPPRAEGGRKPWSKDGARPARAPGGTKADGGGRPVRGEAPRPARGQHGKPPARDGARPARPTGSRDGRPAKDGARPDGPRAQPRDGERPARGGSRPDDAPRETKTQRTARLRADLSVSLRKGGQRGRGVAKAKPPASTKRMRKPGEPPEGEA